MTDNGNDRVQLMESLSISVIDSTIGDNLGLSRNDIIIPYNITNFMLFDESKLITDVLRRFRERQMDVIPDDNWKKLRHESNVEQMNEYLDYMNPNQYRENNIILKKKIIRDKLIDKNLI